MSEPGNRSVLRPGLMDSYRVLFPENVDAGVRPVSGLDIDSLKRAFRNLAFEAHPDRAVHIGVSPDLLQERFIEIKQAYNRVFNYLKNKAEQSRLYSFENNSPKPEKNPPRSCGLPSIVFLTGQYLLYTGWIGIVDLLEAVRWQRQMRPLFGTIALQLYYMNERDIGTVLASKVLRERFGECALRLGIINSFQFRKIIECQKEMQKPIGEYFVMKGIISRDQLLKSLEEHQSHNERASALKG